MTSAKEIDDLLSAISGMYSSTLKGLEMAKNCEFADLDEVASYRAMIYNKYIAPIRSFVSENMPELAGDVFGVETPRHMTQFQNVVSDAYKDSLAINRFIEDSFDICKCNRCKDPMRVDRIARPLYFKQSMLREDMKRLWR